MQTNELKRLFEEGGGTWRFHQMPALRPFESPPPTGRFLRPPVREDLVELQEAARLVRESASRITVSFGITPWQAFQILRQKSVDDQVPLLVLTRAFIGALG